MANFRPMLACHDITEQQWRVLRVLAESGPTEATELAARASILGPSLTRIIKTLEVRQLLIRKKLLIDGRRSQLSITKKGEKLIQALAPERSAIYEAMQRRFGAERQEELLDLLEALIRAETNSGKGSFDNNADCEA